MFCNTVDGAKASAILYSIVEKDVSCRVNVYYYLKFLLEEVPRHLDGTDLNFLEDMLLWSEAYCIYEASASDRATLIQTPVNQDTLPKTPRKKALHPNKLSA